MVKLLDPRADFKLWRRLLKDVRTGAHSYHGFVSAHERVFRGDYRVLKRFRIKRLGFVASHGPLSGRLLAFAQHFLDESSERSFLGGLLFHPDINSETVKKFAHEILSECGKIDIAPLNGHLNLGISAPDPGIDPSKIGFMCSPHLPHLNTFLEESGVFERTRTFHAFETKVNQSLIDRVRESDDGLRNSKFSSRPLSLLHFKRDMRIYNELINIAMSEHHAFEPLSFEDHWDVAKVGPLIFRPEWFRFLTHEGREIGVSFAFPEYNSCLRNDASDALNAAKILKKRLIGQFTRARLVYSAIHPEFRGQGLFKRVRHELIARMVKDGVTEFESSYIDQDNVASIANVRSTGGTESHRFYLYKSV